jgi:hypothetical protein
MWMGVDGLNVDVGGWILCSQKIEKLETENVQK